MCYLDSSGRFDSSVTIRTAAVSNGQVHVWGGGGIVALNYVNSRPRDGHTVLAITPTHLFAMARGRGPLAIDDLVGIARATDDPIVVMVRAESELDTLADLVALGRERPIKWGTTQIGSVDHVQEQVGILGLVLLAQATQSADWLELFLRA